MDERLSWLNWLTYSGRFTHINGHPSAPARAQDRESSPAKDRHSITMCHETNQLKCDGIFNYHIVNLFLRGSACFENQLTYLAM